MLASTPMFCRSHTAASFWAIRSIRVTATKNTTKHKKGCEHLAVGRKLEVATNRDSQISAVTQIRFGKAKNGPTSFFQHGIDRRSGRFEPMNAQGNAAGSWRSTSLELFPLAFTVLFCRVCCGEPFTTPDGVNTTIISASPMTRQLSAHQFRRMN